MTYIEIRKESKYLKKYNTFFHIVGIVFDHDHNVLVMYLNLINNKVFRIFKKLTDDSLIKIKERNEYLRAKYILNEKILQVPSSFEINRTISSLVEVRLYRTQW